MLQLKELCKKYVTGELTQIALDHVSLNLRNSEFVAILGPSGSGKTTLLNIIGGLDRYDSGDVIINGISTKKYKDRDWDSYRNHTIGFVFQSYNLIAHQSVLSNVELALTISGISGKERKKRAKDALSRVGLADQMHKRPGQLSGGQMQRVAIARALVNDPDILLADEPTGALDTQTSIQVMELLKEVARDRLVVMVTHNPDLAADYATRIVRLKDGKIIGDSNPCEIEETAEVIGYQNLGKASMAFRTALSLSFHNLATKKGRTVLTSFAGSIGIIGIALILSMSNGVSSYINDIQKDTMSSYPISIDRQAMDLTSVAGAAADTMGEGKEAQTDGVYVNTTMLDSLSMLTTSFSENDLKSFKAYLDAPDCPILPYVGENGIVYSYETDFCILAEDKDGNLIDAGATSTGTAAETMMSRITAVSSGSSESMMLSNAFEQLLPSEDGLVSNAVKDSYELLYGTWPQNAEELVLVLDAKNEIPVTYLHQLGLLSESENAALLSDIDTGEELQLQQDFFSYEEICGKTYYLVPACSWYQENGQGIYSDLHLQENPLPELADQAVTLHISAIVKADEDAKSMGVTVPVGYTKALTDLVIRMTMESPVVQAQQAAPDVNVLTGAMFAPGDAAQKAAAAKQYLDSLSGEEKTAIYQELMDAFVENSPMGKLIAAKLDGMEADEIQEAMNQYLDTMVSDEMLAQMYDAFLTDNHGSYEENMRRFGVVDPEVPTSISIYADTFEAKDQISSCISAYNAQAGEAQQIVYTDFVGLLMNSVTTIIHTISYVLIAFVAVSLIVSSIMIGIITYISVLERTKEIGILRAIGASKHNISQVFNAETFIIGICSGTMGVVITELLLLPINMMIHTIAGNSQVNASLPLAAALILILLSILLTVIGGFIPAKKAARKDPVTALRTE